MDTHKKGILGVDQRKCAASPGRALKKYWKGGEQEDFRNGILAARLFKQSRTEMPSVLVSFETAAVIVSLHGRPIGVTR